MLAMRQGSLMRDAVCVSRALGALVLVGAMVLPGVRGEAQEEKPAFTLKAYESLMQVPALVLDSSMRPIRHSVDPGRFMVSLDSGKKFSPTNVRVEGDDPLELAIVLDVSGSQKKLVESFPEVAAEFASDALHAHDHLSIYALDCGHLLKSADRIAPEPKAVQQAMEDVLQSPRVAKRLNEGPCKNRVLLWNAMLSVVKDLHESAGRRAMLVVSDGLDRGSSITWSVLHSVAGVQGVALFGMNSLKEWTGQSPDEVPDRFYALCTSTGGVVLHTSSQTAGKTLARWVELLRGRYVIEFPRPQQMTAALHSIVITIRGDSSAIVTVAGVPVTVPSAADLADPDRVHSDAGADIPVGNRRPLLDKR
jgi:hypothetical protein